MSTTSTQLPPAPVAAGPLTAAQRWTLALASVGSFLVVLDLFAVSTALPSLRRSLHAPLTTLDWTINAYTLTFAVLMMTAARLGDRWGRRPVYAAGLLLFTAASAACALAPDAGTLVAARAVQGVGAAVLMPLALALLNAAFPAGRRGWAMGVYGSVTGLATVLGPVLGGVVTQALSWSWIFWINVPVGLATAVAVLLRISGGRGDRRPLDLPGLLLGGAAALALVWGVVRATGSGWADGMVLGALAVAAVALVALVGWERRAAQPLVPMRLFADRGFASGAAAMVLLTASLTAVVFFTAQFLQNAQADGPLAAGLRLLPLGVVPLLLARWTGAASDRVGTRPLILAGLVLQAAGTAALVALAAPGVPYPLLAAALTVVGAGITVSVPALTKSVVGGVPAADLGTASGLFSTVRQLGGAVGVAVTSSAFTAAGGYRTATTVTAGYRGAMVVAAALVALGLLAALAGARRPGSRRPGRS
jgi:EmrB/QacA subfamily drug resistance transporter